MNAKIVGLAAALAASIVTSPVYSAEVGFLYSAGTYTSLNASTPGASKPLPEVLTTRGRSSASQLVAAPKASFIVVAAP